MAALVPIVNGSCCEVKSNLVCTTLKFCGDYKLCDAYSAGGGWLVLQRRQDGSADFNREWVDYEFGSLTGEFWYGLHAINCLTTQGAWQMCTD